MVDVVYVYVVHLLLLQEACTLPPGDMRRPNLDIRTAVWQLWRVVSWQHKPLVRHAGARPCRQRRHLFHG